MNQEINKVAQKVKDPTLSKESREAFYYSELPRVESRLTKPFSFALDSRLEAKEFYVDECKIMNSKKLPLRLSMKASGQDDDDEEYIE